MNKLISEEDACSEVEEFKNNDNLNPLMENNDS